MLQDLDRTLKELLTHELFPVMGAEGEMLEVSFDAPGDSIHDKSAKHVINCFLYDIRENMELRSNDWPVERSNGKAVKKRNPVRVDCSYIITVWTTETVYEHRILGETMRVLLRYRELPEAVLQGELTGQQPPLRTVTLGPQHLQSVGEFWQAMGGKPRASINYTVTISMDINDQVEMGPLVTQKGIDLTNLTEG